MAPQPTTWLDDCDPADWLKEQHRLLSEHYFHEDKVFWNLVSIFGALNGALFAFLGSTFVANNAAGRVFTPLIGIILCFAWLVALIRVREWRLYIEARIEAIEEALNTHWKLAGALALDIRRNGAWGASAPLAKWYNAPYRAFRNAPAARTLLFLPILFLAIWGFSIVEYFFS